jgi:hypothetical protein
MISPITSNASNSNYCCLCSCSLAAADIRPAQRTAEMGGCPEADREIDADEECDFADQDPLSDQDMEEDAQILATLLKNIPSCSNAADIEQLLHDIPVHPPVSIPVRTVHGDLSPLDESADNVFSQSELILQAFTRRNNTNAASLKDLKQRVFHHPDFNVDEVDPSV